MIIFLNNKDRCQKSPIPFHNVAKTGKEKRNILITIFPCVYFNNNYP